MDQPLYVPDDQLRAEADLRLRMLALSEPAPRGGRVLKQPCELLMTGEEQLALMLRLATCPWQPEMIPHVRDAARLAGIRSEGTG